MSVPHYIVFIGAGPSLSTELAQLRKRFSDVRVVAPAASKSHRGISVASIEAALDALVAAMAVDAEYTAPARLTVWSYPPPSPQQLSLVWGAFGRSAWVETLPADLIDKDKLSRLHIERAIGNVLPMLHEISGAIYGGRKTSPLPLPLSNFRSKVTLGLTGVWYNGLDTNQLKREIESLTAKHRQMRVGGTQSFKDERDLLFTPAGDGELHGLPHPTGSRPDAYVSGRFRFGAALYARFHYDVKSAHGKTLKCNLVDSARNERAMAPERREYINIFPNDHLLPESKK